MMEAAGSESSLDLDNLKLLEVSVHHSVGDSMLIVLCAIYHFKQSQQLFLADVLFYTLKSGVLGSLYTQRKENKRKKT